MNDDLLQVSNLYAQYNTDDGVVHAINGVDLNIKRGEVLGLVGETGAGKTSLALSILKLLPDKIGTVTQGSIFYNGEDVLKANRREMLKLRGAKISMIFQDPMSSLNPIVTVGKQIREVLDLHYQDLSSAEKEKRVDDMLELVGIQKSRKDDYPHQFSGGMKQRIVIAMALIAEPELLLADEPTTALDVTIQAQILKLMQELKEQFNSAMVLITHDLGVVAEFCERVAVMYAGQIIEQGTVEEVFGREKNHPYTIGLFNSIPDLTSQVPRLIPIPGYMVNPMNLPEGCSFADRCSHCKESCRSRKPELFGNGSHKIRCFLYEAEED